MIFYNVKNKATGNVAILTKVAKEIIENDVSNKAKYEVLGECDMHGREFNYNNFLNEANGKQSIGIGTTEKETEKHENANGGIDSENITIGQIAGIEEIGKSDDNIGGNTGTNTKGNKPRKNKHDIHPKS